jgi:hypothetical protein
MALVQNNEKYFCRRIWTSMYPKFTYINLSEKKFTHIKFGTKVFAEVQNVERQNVEIKIVTS